jgi:hypothetical protein
MKICQNQECGAVIKKYKSEKRKYCNDKCKNRAAYIKNQEENADKIAFEKAFRKNYKILLMLRGLGLGPISYQTLRSHEFNFDALHKDVIIKYNGNKRTASSLYDLIFIFNDKKELIFI